MKDEFSREEMCCLWLQYAPVSAWRGIDRLLNEYGSASGIYDSFSPAMAETIGKDGFTILNGLRSKGPDVLLADLDNAGIHPVLRPGEGYPSRLRDIPSPPRGLFVMGRLPGNDIPAVAIVGSRRDTRYGRAQARRIARELAESGVVIVSGLARGIDTAAHEGALEGGGITVAVLGNGLPGIYPGENRSLADRIISSGGAVISEYAPGAKPLGYHFPIRNRIISGLSDAVLLIEALRKSGTASTVHHALSQGREIFALPGNVDAPGSELPLQLLKEGAGICTGGEDILSGMGWRRDVKQVSFSDLMGLSEEDRSDPILSALEKEEKTFEELLDETGLSLQEINTSLTLLELEGRIEKRGGRAYALRR